MRSEAAAVECDETPDERKTDAEAAFSMIDGRLQLREHAEHARERMRSRTSSCRSAVFSVSRHELLGDGAVARSFLRMIAGWTRSIHCTSAAHAICKPSRKGLKTRRKCAD